jgi:hypothetical protein
MTTTEGIALVLALMLIGAAVVSPTLSNRATILLTALGLLAIVTVVLHPWV